MALITNRLLHGGQTALRQTVATARRAYAIRRLVGMINAGDKLRSRTPMIIDHDLPESSGMDACCARQHYTYGRWVMVIPLPHHRSGKWVTSGPTNDRGSSFKPQTLSL